MDIDATFLPVAELLVDKVFATPITYHRVSQAPDSYDPVTGTVTKLDTTYAINAGVLYTGRTEQGGAQENRELRLWLHHGPAGVPFLPETGDRVEYLQELWKVTLVSPTYSSKGLIASKLTLNRCTL